MWPYVNQEDLLDPQTLLLLLNSRGRHLPPSFAGADVDAMHLGIVSHAIVPVFLNEHVMILNEVTDLSEYGKLMEWSEHPDAFDWMYTQKQFHPGEGLLVLETQQKLLQFLCRCCIELLHDIPESDLLGISFPILPEPVLKSEGEVNGSESLGVMATEAPYRVPAQLDLAHVQSLLAARASAAEDHIWALREDPDYFVTKLLELKDHRQELLRDLYGGSDPILDRAQRRLLWTRVIGSMVSDAYLKLELSSELSNQAKNLAALQQRYAGELSPLKELPEEYKAALLRFHLYLHQVVKGPLGSLKFTAVASPPLRKFFARQPPPDAYTTKIITVSKPGIRMDKVEQRVTDLLRLLWEDVRGKPQPSSVPVAESEVLLQPNSADPQPTFTVDARAFKVFRTIFFNPAITSTPGEIPWNDFLHAMTSVGFTAMKLYGSVWKFEPTGLDVERNILFHEPHPRGKIPFTMARHYGRRLNRAYGWFGGLFSS
ncbi:uncharacterized protein N7484_009598 [Penicillium longicatenatum]|uniref:uncharacterized protein n=1 Tax=Penicillium longicatenatum TaxID=1561947 RepID=UPI002547654E|nr:uncharacterized protein N7484_009598 [Penicillium longicatenatum]KAJ5636285.1 hypothetical protein N7484_009598 [Penicillium longicatenatum]